MESLPSFIFHSRVNSRVTPSSSPLQPCVRSSLSQTLSLDGVGWVWFLFQPCHSLTWCVSVSSSEKWGQRHFLPQRVVVRTERVCTCRAHRTEPGTEETLLSKHWSYYSSLPTWHRAGSPGTFVKRIIKISKSNSPSYSVD